MNIPIFCLNLERATERKEYIQKEWIDKLGFNINFWKSYDRRDIENNNYIYQYNKELAKQNFGRELSYGEIACATTFCMLYEYLLNNSYEEAIIMEDDIIPLISDKKELFHTIDQGKTEFPLSELMLLHKSRNPHNVSIKREYHSLCKRPCWGNQLFYINKAGLIKTHNILKTMSCPADAPQRVLAQLDIVIASNKPLCDHHWSGRDSTTYIGNSFRRTSRKFIE
jgi:GR25 family glycosyltransferase involved in LPS biosynthesis